MIVFLTRSTDVMKEIGKEYSQQTQNMCTACLTTSAKRPRRWSNIVQMLYNCFVLTELNPGRDRHLN